MPQPAASPIKTIALELVARSAVRHRRGVVEADVFSVIMLSTFCKTTDLTVSIHPLLFERCRLFGGWFQSPAILPRHYKPLDALSFTPDGFVALALNELQDLNLTCSLGGNTTAPASSCRTSGEYWIQLNGYDQYTIGGCLGALAGYIIGARVMAYIGLRIMKSA